MAEFDFRCNIRAALGVADAERAAKALKGTESRRLTYRRPNGGENASRRETQYPAPI
jgi:hypothetical protein